MAAGAGAAAGPGISLTIGLWALVTLIVLMGLKAGWANTLGAAIEGIADRLRFSILGRKVNLGGPLHDLSDAVEDALGRAILANEQVLGMWWHGLKSAVDYLGDSVNEFGLAVHDTIGGLVHGTIPRVAGDLVQPWREQTARVGRQVRVVNKTVTTTVYRTVRAQTAEFDQAFGRAWRGIDHLRDVALPRIQRQVRGVRADVGRLDRQVGRVIPKRLSRLERWLAAGAIGAAAVAAMTRVYPYWQCSNVRRFNRALCRSPFGAWEGLLGLLAFVVVALNPEQVLHAAEDASDELSGIVRTMAGL